MGNHCLPGSKDNKVITVFSREQAGEKTLLVLLLRSAFGVGRERDCWGCGVDRGLRKQALSSGFLRF